MVGNQGKKGTDAQIKTRIATIAEMLIKGYSRENIFRHSAENWNIGERQTENYIKTALDTFIENAQAKQIDMHLALVYEKHNDLYKTY